jgi:hypothetical protein
MKTQAHVNVRAGVLSRRDCHVVTSPLLGRQNSLRCWPFLLPITITPAFAKPAIDETWTATLTTETIGEERMRGRIPAHMLIMSSIGMNFVTVRGGKDDKTRDFSVYEKFIRDASQFVDNALRSPCETTEHVNFPFDDDEKLTRNVSPSVDSAPKSAYESTDHVVLLPDVNGTTFDIYHQWLLNGRLHSRLRPLEVAEVQRMFAPQPGCAIPSIEVFGPLTELSSKQ